MRKVEIIIFTVMCIGTLFISSTRFVNAQITPKWFILIGGMCMIGIWHILRIIQNKPKLYKPHFQYRNPITIISYSIFIQAVYGIAQFIGFSPLTKEKKLWSYIMYPQYVVVLFHHGQKLLSDPIKKGI